MSHSSSQAVQTNFNYAQVGFTARLRAVFAGFTTSEPAALAIYAENANIRATGRNWLM
jgi:hypothetical protein